MAALTSTSEEELGLLACIKPLVEDMWNADSSVPGSTEAKKHQDDGKGWRVPTGTGCDEERIISFSWRRPVY